MKYLSKILAWSLIGLASAWADEFRLAGSWKVVTSTPSGTDIEAELILREKEGKWSGEAKADDWDKARALKEITFEKETLKYALDLEYEGLELNYGVDAEVKDADHLKGRWTATGKDGAELASGAWRAERVAEEVHPLVGAWDATAKGPDDLVVVLKAVFSESEEKLEGKLKTLLGEIAMKSVATEGDQVKLEVMFPYGDESYPVKITATLSEDEMAGRWVAFNAEEDKEEAAGAWSALREGAAVLAGAWAVTATLDDGRENTAVFHFEEKGEAWTGKAVGEDGELVFDRVTLEGKDLVVDLEMPSEGTTIEVRIKASFSGGNGLKGKWVAFNDSGEESASGAWKGVRKAD